MTMTTAWQGGGPRIDWGAVFSDCRRYRYRLWRAWDPAAPTIAFVMLNPSTADELYNDQTVERCERRGRRLGFGAMIVTNAFALRSTNPNGLRQVADPIGPDNDAAIARAAAEADLVVCGWGKHCEAVAPGRGAHILATIRHAGRTPHALRVNADGSPQHPLYIGYGITPQPMSESATAGAPDARSG